MVCRRSRSVGTQSSSDSKSFLLELSERLVCSWVDGPNHALSTVGRVSVGTLLTVEPDGLVLERNICKGHYTANNRCTTYIFHDDIKSL